MLIRILSRATRTELYSLSTYCSGQRKNAPTTWGTYGPDGAFERMMTTLRNDKRIRSEGGYLMCVQSVDRSGVVRKQVTEFYL